MVYPFKGSLDVHCPGNQCIVATIACSSAQGAVSKSWDTYYCVYVHQFDTGCTNRKVLLVLGMQQQNSGRMRDIWQQAHRHDLNCIYINT